MFKLEIHVGGAAYRDPMSDADKETNVTPMDPSRSEIIRNLSEVCEKLEIGYNSGCILDFNGNVTGKFELKDDY